MKTLQLEHCVVSIPDQDTSPAVVVYGGLYGWEGAWLLNKIPKGTQQKLLFVLPKHFKDSCKTCLDEMHASVSSDRISSFSLCGYSRGAVEVYRNRDLEEWKILGLIDPTAPTMGGFLETVLDADTAKIRCVYWVPNWGAGGYSGKIPSFAKHLRDLKVKMVEKETPHADMPTLFFREFGGDF